MEYKEAYMWLPDNNPESTPAIVVVSRCGIVKRLEYKRWCKKNNGYCTKKEIILKQSCNRGKQRSQETENKYMHVHCGDKTMSVHRLVALAWIPNPLKKPFVNHINGMKNDNRVENLEWCTNSENIQHARDIGLPRKSIEKVTDSQALEMKRMRINGMKLAEIAKIYNVTGECVRYRTSKIMNEKEKIKARQKNNRWKNYNG